MTLKKTDKKMACDECATECDVKETRGAILDNLLYRAQCQKCGTVFTSDDGIHWNYLYQCKPEEGKNERK